MVTARGSEADKIRGLKLGADDYITKPLSFPELSRGSRRRCVGRRRRPRSGPRRLRHRDLVVDLDEHRAHLRGDGGRPHADRVPAPRPPRRTRRPARHAPPDPGRGLGCRLRPRRAPAPDDGPQPAPQARRGRSGRAVDHDRVRPRLPPGRARVGRPDGQSPASSRAASSAAARSSSVSRCRRSWAVWSTKPASRRRRSSSRARWCVGDRRGRRLVPGGGEQGGQVVETERDLEHGRGPGRIRAPLGQPRERDVDADAPWPQAMHGGRRPASASR